LQSSKFFIFLSIYFQESGEAAVATTIFALIIGYGIARFGIQLLPWDLFILSTGSKSTEHFWHINSHADLFILWPSVKD
jgi:hypothetical protein